MDVLCLIQVRNEERYLPGFLGHVAPHVDGIVALDDCSGDRTLEILRSEPKVVSVLRETRAGPAHANEVSNRHRLILEAARLGAAWVICADADERFEEPFLRRLRAEAEQGERQGRPVRFVRLVNLWNAPDRYRVDGRCAPRWSARMFELPATITRRSPGMHQPWFPPELDHAPRAFMRANLYHLKMIERRDREARFAKFTALDPDHRQQACGYDHLIDESGLTLRPVPPWRRYLDQPAGQAGGRPGAAPPLPAGCLADQDFVRRFQLDPLSRPRHPPAVAGPGQGPPAGDRPRALGAHQPPARPRGHYRLHGFDFSAIFDALRTGT